ISGQGEFAFAELLDALKGDGPLDRVRGLSYRRNGSVVTNAPRPFVHPDTLPPLPYHRFRLPRYLARTYLGKKTVGYHSSYGCPFTCGFCAVAAVYDGRWLARDPHAVARDLLRLRKEYGIDSVEFFDDNFFVSEERTREFARGILGKGINWW